MAGELVENPNIQQTFAHDLESFINGTMNPRVCNGNGGFHKRMFLAVPIILNVDEREFTLSNNRPLSALLVQMKHILGKWYYDPPSKKESQTDDSEIDAVAIALGVQESDESREALRAAAKNSESTDYPELGDLKYKAVVRPFAMFLSSVPNWPNDDKAKAYRIL